MPLPLALLLLVALVLVPVRVHLNLQGRGDPSGAWVLAGGVQVGPVAVSGLGARGVEPTVQAHLFGRRVWQRDVLALMRGKRAEPEEEAPDEASTPSVRERYRRFERWLDPASLPGFVLDERRRIRVTRLDIDLEYSFMDVATTGKAMAALYALSGVLPPPILLRQTPAWDDVDRAEGSVTGVVRVLPGLMVCDTIVFLVKHLRLRRRPDETAPTPPTTEDEDHE